MSTTATKASRIDLVFDQYFSPSIRDYERDLRHEERSINNIITGPEQTRPVDYAKELKKISFKEALVKFLIKHWITDEMVPFIGNTVINVNYKHCHNYAVKNNSVISIINDNLSSINHEEADKILHHICQINEDNLNILIKSSDTDVLIIMLGKMNHLSSDSLHIFMEYVTGNKKRCLAVSELYVKLTIFIIKFTRISCTGRV